MSRITNYFVIAVLTLISVSVLAGNACQNPTWNKFSSAQQGLTALQALKSDVNTVPGTAKNIASCVMVGDVNVTACLTEATFKYQHQTAFLLDIYGQSGTPWSTGAYLVEGGNTTVQAVDGVTTVNLIQFSDYLRRALRMQIIYDSKASNLVYRSWYGDLVKGQPSNMVLQQNQTFVCGLIQ